MRCESGREGGHEANGASRCWGCAVCGVWCVVCASRRCPGATQGRRAQQEAGQVKFKVAGPCLRPTQTGTGDPTAAAGRAACIKTRRCGVGVERKTEKEKKKKRRDQTKKRRGGKCACVQARKRNRDAAWMGVAFTQAPAGCECSAAGKAGTKPRLGILKELQHHPRPSGSSHCEAAAFRHLHSGPSCIPVATLAA